MTGTTILYKYKLKGCTLTGGGGNSTGDAEENVNLPDYEGQNWTNSPTGGNGSPDGNDSVNDDDGIESPPLLDRYESDEDVVDEDIDDKIDDNDLDPCSKAILDEFREGKSIEDIVNQFAGEDSDFNWTLETSNTTDAANTTWLNDASNNSIPKNFITKINPDFKNSATKLALARTILHEGIHARLREFASRNGSNSVTFPGVFDYFRLYEKNWDHQQMADFYRATNAEGLKQYENNQHSWQYYMDLAWEGLAGELTNLNDPNGNSTFTTQAWNNLSLSEQNRIIGTVRNEKENGSKSCE